MLEQPELIEYFQEKRRIPVNILSKHTKQSKIFIEKYSDYIITYAVIFSNPNYKLIQDYMKIDEIEDTENDDKKEEQNIIPFNQGEDKGVRGIVLKKMKNTLFILTSMGEFKKIKSGEECIVGEEVSGTIKKGFKEYKIHIGIAIVILVAILGGFYFKYTSVDRTILINTTSQIKLHVNSFGKVVDAYSGTTKGQEMLNKIDTKNAKLDDAMKNILEYAKDNKMLPEGSILVTVTGDPIKYGTLEETSEFVHDNDIRLRINNAGNEQKLF